MLTLCSLSSGSKGNAFFIKTGTDAYLIDVGISCRQICDRIDEIGHSYRDIRGVFISHEHSDHIRGLPVLLKKHPVPVYISRGTLNHTNVEIPDSCLRLVRNDSRILLDNTDVEVEVLKKSHDACDPSFFNVKYRGLQTSVITDIGYGCNNVTESIRQADILFLESNYDEAMLANGFYPPFLQKRITGREGHISNRTAAHLIRKFASSKLSHVFLSHLSENNNTPELAMSTFREIVEQRKDLRFRVHLTSIQGVSEVVEIPVDSSSSEAELNFNRPILSEIEQHQRAR
mgnify:CR=1 FL=1